MKKYPWLVGAASVIVAVSAFGTAQITQNLSTVSVKPFLLVDDNGSSDQSTDQNNGQSTDQSTTDQSNGQTDQSNSSSDGSNGDQSDSDSD